MVRTRHTRHVGAYVRACSQPCWDVEGSVEIAAVLLVAAAVVVKASTSLPGLSPVAQA